MIRLLFWCVNTLGGLVVKLLILIALTNLLYAYFHGHPFDWASLLSLEALPEKLMATVKTIIPLVRDWAYELKEVSGPVIDEAKTAIEKLMEKRG